MSSVRILDLDNCIADDAWRIPMIAWQHADVDRRYHDYHSLAPFDNLGNAQLIQTSLQLVILTARPVMYHAATEEWLRRKGVQFKHLVMRNLGDHSHSVDLKFKQVRWLLGLYGIALGEIADAYDDRADVVEMYRSFGFRAEVAAIHSTCAYTPPGAQPGASPALPAKLKETP